MTQKDLLSAFKRLFSDNSRITGGCLTGRIVLLAETKDLIDETNYRPITYLNTSCKKLTELIVKYMREHTLLNKIWDERQLGVVVGVLGTVDQHIIHRFIMEEVKQCHRNLAVALYN